MSFKVWVFISIGLFVIGIASGLATPPAILTELINEDMAALRELAAILEPFQVTTAIFIFLKNVSALLISFIFSPILCLVPILALTANGWLISFVSVAVVQEESLGFLLAGLLPHGVFELPALIIGEAAALSSGALIIVALVSKERRNLLLPGLKKNLIFLLVACALLLPAAVIETYVTPLFLS